MLYGRALLVTSYNRAENVSHSALQYITSHISQTRSKLSGAKKLPFLPFRLRPYYVKNQRKSRKFEKKLFKTHKL
jgi:hypothetical protein